MIQKTHHMNLLYLINNKLKLKVHWAVSDYLQRASRHIGSSVDIKQAYAIGKKCISYAKKGITDVMITIHEKKQKEYAWEISHTKLENVANKEKKMPKTYITKDGFNITSNCKNYISNLIQGEDFPPFKDGVPDYADLKLSIIKKKLSRFKV